MIDGNGIYEGIESPIKVARYHSLAIDENSLPSCLKVTARTADGQIMSIKHEKYPTIGIQYHPESIYTDHGKRIIENFLRMKI